MTKQIRLMGHTARIPSPVHRKLHGSSVRTAVSLSSPPLSPSGKNDGYRSKALTVSAETSMRIKDNAVVFTLLTSINTVNYNRT